jgi:hypothetical protein
VCHTHIYVGEVTQALYSKSCCCTPFWLLQAGVNAAEQLQLPLAVCGSLPIGMCLESLNFQQYNAARHIPHQSFGGM